MIRRDATNSLDGSKQWILIPQIEHARLAGELAKHWGAGPFARLEPRDELVWAIAHHDDGWRDWDENPQVDPRSGRPRSFTEMEIDDSVSIWTGSIETAAAAGPLEGYVVAGHFCALGRRAAAWKHSDAHWSQAQRFLDHYGQAIDRWLADWQRADPANNTPEIARRALAELQWFDALSLWFCCAEADGPDEVEAPEGIRLALKPRDPMHISLDPWPLDVPALELEVIGRAVPIGHYADQAQLRAARGQPARLCWRLEKCT